MMSTLEQDLSGVIDIFHKYTAQEAHYDTLSKGKLRELITTELAYTIENTKDQPTVNQILQELDAHRDKQVDFDCSLSLMIRVLKTAM